MQKIFRWVPFVPAFCALTMALQADAGVTGFRRVEAAPGISFEIPQDWHVCSQEVIQEINNAAGVNSYNGMAFDYYMAATDRPVGEDFSSMVVLYVNPFVVSPDEADTFIRNGRKDFFLESVRQAMLSVTSAVSMECRYLEGLGFPAVKVSYISAGGGIRQRFVSCIAWTCGRAWMLNLGLPADDAEAEGLFGRIWKSFTVRKDCTGR